jgi:hypothetical protein
MIQKRKRLFKSLLGVVCLGAIFLPSSALLAQEASEFQKIEKLSSINRSPFVQFEYMLVDKIESTGKIAASYRDGVVLSNNDTVYLEIKSGSVSVGDRFTVFKPVGAVKAPGQIFGKVGERLHILGSLRVTKILPDLVEGILYDFNEDAQVGDLVVPLIQTQVELKPQDAAVKIEGRVLAPAGRNHLAGSFEMVFIDKGSSHGLRVNDRLEIVRKGEGADKKMRIRLPEVPIAKLVVVHTNEKFSTAYIESAIEAFESGAKFRTAIREEIYLEDKKASQILPLKESSIQVGSSPR